MPLPSILILPTPSLSPTSPNTLLHHHYLDLDTNLTAQVAAQMAREASRRDWEHRAQDAKNREETHQKDKEIINQEWKKRIEEAKKREERREKDRQVLRIEERVREVVVKELERLEEVRRQKDNGRLLAEETAREEKKKMILQILEEKKKGIEKERLRAKIERILEEEEDGVRGRLLVREKEDRGGRLEEYVVLTQREKIEEVVRRKGGGERGRGI